MDGSALPLSPPRARLAEAVASFGAAAYRNRGARFLARVSPDGHPISFNNLRRMPRWWSAAEEDRDTIATIAALLNYRDQIDQELDGARLRALVGTTGETVFDLACSHDFRCDPVADTIGQPLPIGDDVRRSGWIILHRALPNAFATNIPAACGDRAALEIADQAWDLWQRHRDEAREATAIENGEAAA